MGSDKAYGTPSARTRIFSFAALAGVAALVGWAGREGYRAATDSFVAPIILSPESDAVLATKLHASQLEAERVKTASELERIDADLTAGASAIARLEALVTSQRDPRAWFVEVQGQAASASARELAEIGKQKAHLAHMIREQEQIAEGAKANVEANVITKPEYTREVLALSHLKLALFDTERARVKSQLDASQARLARTALEGSGPTMPELIAREEQMTRIALELMRLEAEQRTKRSERATLTEKLAKIDELDAQLRARPIYRATQARVEAAFVPYTQLEGVERGGVVHDCTWGMFRCKPVGTVAEIVPGEVVLPDPWGHQARGQYAILDLRDHGAARSKILRVRSGGAAPPKAQSTRGGAVTSR